MKRFYLLIIGLFTMLLMPSVVSAANASIGVSASNTVMLGNNVTVTVTLSSGTNIGSWEMDLSYDKAYLQLTNSSAEGGGTRMVGYASNGSGIKSKSYTFTFKTLKSGDAKVSVGSYTAYDYSTMAAMSVTGGSKTISIKTKEEIEATYSSNAFLKSISVGEYKLDPEFNKNTKEYSVEVENEVEVITLSAAKEDGNASVSGTGEKTLIEGNNKFEIICTAQKGNSITYVVNVYRKELDPITVSVDKKEYTIVRRSDILEPLSTFQLSTTMYEETEIPSLYSEITGYTLIGLKDDDGNILYYIYEDGKVKSLYVEIGSGSVKIYPLELPDNELFIGYNKKEIDFNGLKVYGYVFAKNSKFAVIYGQNVESGDVLYYSYSFEDKSIQPYNKEINEFYNKKINNYKYVIIGSLAVIFVLLFIIVVRKPSKKNKDSNRELKDIIEEHVNEEIKEEIEELEEQKVEEETIEEEKTKKSEEIVEEEKEEDTEDNSSQDDEEEKEEEEEVKVDEVKELDMEDYEDDFVEEELSKTKQLTRRERKAQRKAEKQALKDF